jgi:hypothetical protein
MENRLYGRTRACTAALALGCLLLLTQFGASASAADTAPTITFKVGVQQDDLDRLRADARGARAPRRDARQAPGARAPALSIGQAEAASRRNADGVTTTPLAAPMAVAPIGEQPDAGQAEECFDGSGVETSVGRIHNRFTYCQRIGVVAEYWEIDNKGIPIEKEGTTTATLEVISQGDNVNRRVRAFARIQEGSVDYDWGPIDNILVAPDVPLSIIGQCSQDNRVCHATRGAATMPWVVWDHNDDWFYWDVYNHEEASEGRDKISFNRWFVELFTEDGEYHTIKRGRTNPRLVRCDSADYFRQGLAHYPKACVFSEVTPRLTYRLDSDHRSVAFHIFTAQHHPNNTYPLLVPFGVPNPRDKRIPGRYVADDPEAPGLHRITETLHPAEYLANRQHKDGACFKTGPLRDEYFDTGLPNPPGPGEQCDEYPFASTLEGAGNPFWDFSVKAVPQPDNSKAGALLSNYYINDRILAWDPELDRPDETNDRFYVHIE